MPFKRRNNQNDSQKSRNSKAVVSHDHKGKTELKSQIRRLKKEQNSFFYKLGKKTMAFSYRVGFSLSRINLKQL